MINADQLAKMIATGEQDYVYLFLLAALGCWFFYLAWRSQRLRTAMLRINIPLPHLTIAPILVLGLIIRIPRIFDSLWYDESFTARIAGLPLSQLPAAIMGDVHPPLWYSFEWFWTKLAGNSEIALRLPSLVLGLLLIWLVYRLALALGMIEQVALVAALIVALLQAPAYYSVEARGYVLLACLAMTMMIAIRKNRPLLFGICGVAICWTHNLGYFYLLVLGLFAVWRWHGEEIWDGWFPNGRIDLFRWLEWLIVPGAVASLWLPFALQQSKVIADGFWIQPFSAGMGLRLYMDMTIGRQLAPELAPILYLLIFLLTLLGLFSARRWLVTVNGLQWLALTVGVPAAVALASILWHPVYLTRALLPCGVALALIWAHLLIHAPARGLARLVALPVLFTAIICFYAPWLGGREDVRNYVAPCAGVSAVYSTSIPASMFDSYYIDAPLINWPGAGDLNQTLTPESKAAYGLIPGNIDDLRGDVCLLALDTPVTTDSERAQIASIAAKYPYSLTTFIAGPLYQVRVYRLTIGGKNDSAKHH